MKLCKILLPIKPEYVEKIFSGEKKYEYRKTKTKKKVSKIIIYATSPIMKVVGEVDVNGLIVNKLDNVWETTKKYSGISDKYFYDYYENRLHAIAYRLGNVVKYSRPMDLHEIGINFVPQSYVYLDER